MTKDGDMIKHLLGMQSTRSPARRGDNVDVVICRRQNVILGRLRGLPRIAANFNPPPATVAFLSTVGDRMRARVYLSAAHGGKKLINV